MGIEHYLYHDIVTRQDKASTKRRIVFDAPAKDIGGVSLNDCFNAEPNLNPELMAVLNRFTMKKKAFRGDIEKAFLQIRCVPQIETPYASSDSRRPMMCVFNRFIDTNPDTEQ